MQDCDLDPVVESVLRAAGWTPGRRVDISPGIDVLESNGYYVNDWAANFLEEFEDIKVALPRYPSLKMKMPYSFGGYHWGDKPSPEWVDHWSDLIDDELCPVGGCDIGHLIYFVADETGAIYSGYERCLRKVAETFPEFFNALAYGDLGEDIYVPRPIR